LEEAMDGAGATIASFFSVFFIVGILAFIVGILVVFNIWRKPHRLKICRVEVHAISEPIIGF
jgi:hypothetical protein